MAALSGWTKFASLLIAPLWLTYPGQRPSRGFALGFLVWGFWLVSKPASRGVMAALSGWTKFASLIVAPLWLTYPGRRPPKRSPTSQRPSSVRRSNAIEVKCAAGSVSHFPLQPSTR